MKRIPRILMFAVFVATAPASALGAVPTETEAAAEGKSPFAGSAVALGQGVGLGTFVANEYARTPQVSTSLMLMPRYSFEIAEKKFVASMREMFAVEETRPDNATGRRFAWSDATVMLAAPRIVTEPFTGVSVTPSVRYAAPLSLESLFASSFGTLGAAVALDRAFGSFELNGSFTATKGLFRYSSRVATSDEALVTDDDSRAVMLCRGGEQFCGSAGMNSDFAFRTALAVRYRFTDSFALGASWMLVNDFRYAATDVVDEYTPKAVDSNGDLVANTGHGRSDSSWGVIEAEYGLNDHIALTAELATVGPAKTRDNQGLRFPFFDFVSPANNLTSFSVGVTAIY